MTDRNVRESEVLQLHSGELKNELRLSGLVLKANFFYFTQNKGLHIRWMKTKAS